MSTSSLYRLSFPRALTEAHVVGLLQSLNGSSSVHAQPLALGVRGHRGQIDHFVRADRARGAGVQRAASLLPGLLLEEQDGLGTSASFVWRLWQSTSRRPLRTDRSELVSRAVLSALLQVRGGERLELRWLFGPVRRAQSVGSQHPPMFGDSWPLTLATAAINSPGDLDAEARQALRSKRSEPAWRLLGTLAVGGTTDVKRAQRLASGLLAALRTAEGPGVRLGVRRMSPGRLDRRPLRWPVHASVTELVGLLACPIGDAGDGLPVRVQRARQLRPRVAQPKQGRVLGLMPGDRPLRLSEEDGKRHLLIVGPTGSGKSNLLLSLVLQDIAAGRSLILLDPKGDLCNDVLGAFPPGHEDELVIIDPRDPSPVGINPLYKAAQPSLVADQLLGVFTALYGDALGPRTTDVLAASLLTLARWGEGSLATLPLLLNNPALRRRIVGAQEDPFGTGPFWSYFERLKDAERQQVVNPSLNKVRSFTTQPDLRAVLGQAEPRFQFSDLVTKRRVVLINLAKHSLGPVASMTLGAIVLNQALQALQGRQAIAPARRKRIGVYVDEIADYLRLPGDIGEALIQARSMGVSFALASQTVAQLPPALRQIALSQARSRVVFQPAADDARVLADGHPELEALDLLGLEPFSAYASLLQGNQVQPYVSLRTEPPGAPTRNVDELRALSRERWGRPRAETDAALQALLSPAATTDEPVGRRPRRTS